MIMSKVLNKLIYTKLTPPLQETADLVALTEEILSGKLHFLCSGVYEVLPRVVTRLVLIHIKTHTPALNGVNFRDMVLKWSVLSIYESLTVNICKITPVRTG